MFCKSEKPHGKSASNSILQDSTWCVFVLHSKPECFNIFSLVHVSIFGLNQCSTLFFFVKVINKRTLHWLQVVSLMWWATMIDTAQTREGGNCLGQLQRSPACVEKRWRGEKKQHKRKKNILFIHLHQRKSLSLSLSLYPPLSLVRLLRHLG